MILAPSDALKIVAEHAQASVVNDDDQLALCDALTTLAESLGLLGEANKSRRLAAALRDRADAQMEFLAFFMEGGKTR